jgi:hypothetical protein
MDGLPVLEAHLQGYGRTRDRTGDNCHRVLRQIPSLFGRHAILHWQTWA